MVSWFRQKKALTNVIIPLARDNLPGLVRNLTSNAINKFEKKKWKGSCQSRNRFTLFISNEDMNDIIEITKLLEDSGVLIDGVTETVKHKLKNKNVNFLEIY